MLPWYLTSQQHKLMSQQQHHDNLQQEVYMTILYSTANAIRGTENSQYPGNTWRHLVDSDLSCHMVLGSTCRFLPHTVKSFHSSFHTNNMAGNLSCQCVMDSLMIHRSIPCLNLFNISRKTSPFLCTLSVLVVGNTNMMGSCRPYTQNALPGRLLRHLVLHKQAIQGTENCLSAGSIYQDDYSISVYSIVHYPWCYIYCYL